MRITVGNVYPSILTGDRYKEYSNNSLSFQSTSFGTRSYSDYQHSSGFSSAVTGALWGIPIGIVTGLIGQALEGQDRNKAFKKWGIAGFIVSTVLGYYFGSQKHKKGVALQDSYQQAVLYKQY